MNKPILRIISLGAGVQSSAMLLMALEGEIARPDCAIFADTGDEPQAVYDHLARLKARCEASDFPLHVVGKSAKCQHPTLSGLLLSGSARARFSLPVFDSTGQYRRRQCTADYKIGPIVSFYKRQVKAKDRYDGCIEQCLGISTDEAGRMKPNREPWIRNTYPLIDIGFSRKDCLRWLQEHGWTAPKSACVFCPFCDVGRFAALEQAGGPEWAKVLAVQDALTPLGLALRRDWVPAGALPLFEGNQFGNECEGHCGV